VARPGTDLTDGLVVDADEATKHAAEKPGHD
jgi:hypothetical protein